MNNRIEVIADRIRSRMNSLNVYKQIDLSTRTNVPRTTINKLLSLKSMPKIDTMADLAIGLNTSVDYLIGLTDDPTPPYQKQSIDKETSISIQHVDWNQFSSNNWQDEVKNFYAINKIKDIESDQLLTTIIGTDSMEPEFYPGDRVIVDRNMASIKNSDLVIFTIDKDVYLARVKFEKFNMVIFWLNKYDPIMVNRDKVNFIGKPIITIREVT